MRNELVKQTLSLSFCSTSASASRTLSMTGLRNAPEAFEKKVRRRVLLFGRSSWAGSAVHGADHEVTSRVYREPDDIQMLPSLSDINIRKNSPTHRPRSFPDRISPRFLDRIHSVRPSNLGISPPPASPYLPYSLVHLAFQPVQFLLGDLECAGERHADEREDVGEGVDSFEKGVCRMFESMQRLWRIP
jgi:hypothetical protein